MRQTDVLERHGAALFWRGRRCGFRGQCSHRRRRLERLDLQQQLRQQLDEGLDQCPIERAPRLVLEQVDRALVAERVVVRTLRRHRVVVVDDSEDAGTDRNRFSGQSLRITLAVPSFVVAHDERCHRIWERHAGDDLGAHLRMNPDLLEFFGRERTWLRQDVFGDREFADVVQQGRGADALNVRLRQADRFCQSGGVDLHSQDVRVRHLVFGVDGAGQRFDRRQMQIGTVLHMPLHFQAAHVDLVGVVRQIDWRKGERRHPQTHVVHGPSSHGGRACANEVARCAPQEVGVPRRAHRLPGRECNGRRHQGRVHQEIGERGANERTGHGGNRVGVGRAQQREGEARRFDGDDQRRHAEERPVGGRFGVLVVPVALAERAGGGHQHRFVWANQEQGGKVERVRHRQRRHVRRHRQRHLECGAGTRQHEQREEQQRLRERRVRQAKHEQRGRSHDRAPDEHASGERKLFHVVSRVDRLDTPGEAGTLRWAGAGPTRYGSAITEP